MLFPLRGVSEADLLGLIGPPNSGAGRPCRASARCSEAVKSAIKREGAACPHQDHNGAQGRRRCQNGQQKSGCPTKTVPIAIPGLETSLGGAERWLVDGPAGVRNRMVGVPLGIVDGRGPLARPRPGGRYDSVPSGRVRRRREAVRRQCEQGASRCRRRPRRCGQVSRTRFPTRVRRSGSPSSKAGRQSRHPGRLPAGKGLSGHVGRCQTSSTNRRSGTTRSFP